MNGSIRGTTTTLLLEGATLDISLFGEPIKIPAAFIAQHMDMVTLLSPVVAAQPFSCLWELEQCQVLDTSYATFVHIKYFLWAEIVFVYQVGQV